LMFALKRGLSLAAVRGLMLAVTRGFRFAVTRGFLEFGILTCRPVGFDEVAVASYAHKRL
jgi:hypothetical protein